MKIVLTSDVELWSWNKNFEQDVEKGVLELVRLCEKEKVPITLFISLSDKGYGCYEYLARMKEFLKKVNSKYVSFGVHTHCMNLPVSFITKSDDLRDYSEEQIREILIWYKKILGETVNKKVTSHRAGSYRIPELEVLDKGFFETGLKFDSSDVKQDYSKIIKKKNFLEIPPATNRELWEKNAVWSPEQMEVGEMIDFFEKSKSKTNTLVMNFHSFSVFGSLGRKAGIWRRMPRFVRYLVRPAIRLMKRRSKQQAKNTSESFENFKNIIGFLKQNKCKFTGFDND